MNWIFLASGFLTQTWIWFKCLLPKRAPRWTCTLLEIALVQLLRKRSRVFFFFFTVSFGKLYSNYNLRSDMSNVQLGAYNQGFGFIWTHKRKVILLSYVFLSTELSHTEFLAFEAMWLCQWCWSNAQIQHDEMPWEGLRTLVIPVLSI